MLLCKPNNTQQNTRLWFSRLEEFAKDIQTKILNLDTLHVRMIELEEINNADYNGANITDEETVRIFEHTDMSNRTPDGLLRKVFYG
nr:8262_t:CDS:2 [Entrophospora candida]CAG8434990.1 11129_t:CDS:2 [Entrophospora candida]